MLFIQKLKIFLTIQETRKLNWKDSNYNDIKNKSDAIFIQKNKGLFKEIESNVEHVNRQANDKLTRKYNVCFNNWKCSENKNETIRVNFQIVKLKSTKKNAVEMNKLKRGVQFKTYINSRTTHTENQIIEEDKTNKNVAVIPHNLTHAREPFTYELFNSSNLATDLF